MTDLPRPFKPRVDAPAMNSLHRVLERNPIWYGLALFLLKTPPLYRAFTFVERLVKHSLFACRMCGQCALPVTAYACPMTSSMKGMFASLAGSTDPGLHERVFAVLADGLRPPRP